VIGRRVLKSGCALGALSAVLAIGACQPAATPRLTDAERTALADSVKQQVVNLFAALAHPVPDSILASYDSASLVWARSGSLLHYDSLAAGVRRTWGSGASAYLGTSDVTVKLLGRNGAVWSGIISGTYRHPGGKESDVRAAITLVLQRQAGQWRIVAGHESAAPQTLHESEVESPPESRTQ
jgi:hypothetical protein